jgi:hypothetical protein
MHIFVGRATVPADTGRHGGQPYYFLEGFRCQPPEDRGQMTENRLNWLVIEKTASVFCHLTSVFCN